MGACHRRGPGQGDGGGLRSIAVIKDGGHKVEIFKAEIKCIVKEVEDEEEESEIQHACSCR